MKRKEGGIFMPGKNFIKIPSIFMAIGGAISIIVYLILGLFLSYATVNEGENMGWLVVALAVVYTVLSLLEFIAAAKGIKGCDKKEAAEELRKWGIVLLVVSFIAGVFNFISSILQGGSIVSGLISAILGLLFPILYIYGASLNQKAC